MKKMKKEEIKTVEDASEYLQDVYDDLSGCFEGEWIENEYSWRDEYDVVEALESYIETYELEIII